MAMDQLQALLEQLKTDEGLQEKLKGAADINAAVAIAKEAGFDVSKGDWLMHKRLIGPHWLWEWSWI
jgi:predicted ribosomally synthesized peptide with nif11-like leader